MGPRGGSSLVVLTGQGFDDLVSVTFGDQQAELLSSTAEQVELLTPASETVGTVDVELTAAAGSALASSAFEYLDFDDESGLTGVLGASQWYEILGSYWTEPVDDYGLAQLWFLQQPAAAQYWEFFSPSVETCSSDGFLVDTSTGMDLGEPYVTLETDGGTWVDLSPDDEHPYFAANLDSLSFLWDSSYELQVSGASGLPDLYVPDSVVTPPSFTLISPELDGSTVPAWPLQDLEFSWTITDSDHALIYIARIDARTSEILEKVSCVADNDGDFTVPATAWAGWQPGDWLYVYFGTSKAGSATMPHDNSSSAVAGIHWKVGAAQAQ